MLEPPFRRMASDITEDESHRHECRDDLHGQTWNVCEEKENQNVSDNIKLLVNLDLFKLIFYFPTI